MSKFEVDIKKIKNGVTMQFCLGTIPQTATGCHPNFNFVDAFFCHKCIKFSLSITPITKYDISTNMES